METWLAGTALFLVVVGVVVAAVAMIVDRSGGHGNL